MPSNSVHAIVTDPPYGLEFMGKEWDKFKIVKHEKMGGFTRKGKMNWSEPFQTGLPRFSNQLKEPSWKTNYQKWTTSWAKEAFRILKSGSSMFVMGGTRTYHRMACGVEDAGFQIKDTLCWVYASGFPKALDLGKMIDKRLKKERKVVGRYKHPRSIEQEKEIDNSWGKKSLDNKLEGYVTQSDDKRTLIERLQLTAPSSDLAKKWNGWKVGGLKPAYEPIIWAIKPPEGSYIDNVLRYGVGAINIDACRIPVEREIDKIQDRVMTQRANGKAKGWGMKPQGKVQVLDLEKGRYPSNIIRTNRFEDGYDRFYFIPKAGRSMRWFKCKICKICHDGTYLKQHDSHAFHCYDCKVNFRNTEEDKEIHKNHKTESNLIMHPTVKPLSLMKHLIKLVTREGQIVVDPFVGTGTTSVAAYQLKRKGIGIDKNKEYIEIAKARLASYTNQKRLTKFVKK